jgi:hypothetical protein
MVSTRIPYFVFVLILCGCRSSQKLPLAPPMLMNPTAILDHVPSAEAAKATPPLDKAGIRWTETCEHMHCSLFVSAKDKTAALKVIHKLAAVHVPK